MPASPHVARYANDDYLRQLLDQRTTRADLLGRFSTISECSDTPSVYSRTQFSPGPSVSGDHSEESRYTAAPSSQARPNANFDTVGSSMLDLGYDQRTSYAPSETRVDDPLAYEDEGEVDTSSRMSYLGPKMRFHSRAPWEMDETALDEEDEEDNHARSGYSSSRSDASKTYGAGPSSPRPSQVASRRSGESSRSRVPPKRSFETIDSQVSYPRGALYALAQESLSATSLGRVSTAPLKETIRSKFSRSRPPPDISTGSQPNPSISSAHGQYPPSPTFDTSFQAGSNFSQSYKNLASSEHAHMHPYANPDLVVSYAEEQSPRSNSLSKFANSRNDSSVTVTGTFSMDSITKSSTTLTPDSSVHSFRKQRASSILSKTAISSPVPVVNPHHAVESTALDNNENLTGSPPPNVSSIAGWTERNAAPAFSLISLEEARAKRLRNAASQQSISISSSSRTSNLSGSAPPTDTDFSRTLQEAGASLADDQTRARGRSMSAGAKARNAISTIVPRLDRRDSEPATAGLPPQPANGAQGKTLKHKKSGFMRLFNGNKSHEKSDDEPPPVPVLPESDKYQAPQRTPRSVIQRIPVPSLSPSLYEVASSTSSSLPDSPSRKLDMPTSPKRAPPPALSINTLSNGTSRASTSAVADRDGLAHSLRPWASGLQQQPQSAPANMHEFPALRLRPVSTLFSAHFGDHIVPESRSSEETAGIETPRSSSPNGLMSPLSPVSLTRTSTERMITSVIPESDDQLTVKGLQKQLASSKVAMQRQIWELEGQVRDLQAELEDTKGKYGDQHCNACGRGKKFVALPPAASGGGVVNRPRARTGTSSRFGKV
ncbi:hypothetical protein D9619_003138 [Psilocybe cf. subviscida]|uniref:Uncharacterized protein n=1 Tax=Psilocybe cf. subviscida TaxID=2480587 RepID=A0A8H5AW00_9AGAR|nr:hypothetical protein D9619_003138 [Psilocybe cf. subviscida]